MNLKIIHREDLNVEKWDELVARSMNAAFFSYSWCLDSIAENWCVITNDSYSIGLALPYTERMRQRILYTPIFVSYLELLGNKSALNYEELKKIIFSSFKLIEVEFKEPILGDDFDTFVCQFFDGTGKRKPQVNRMLNKSKRFELTVRQTSNWKSIFKIIQSELNNKFSGMSDVSLARLSEMFETADQHDFLRAFEVIRDDKCQGGIICFQDEKQVFYSKGAVMEETRDNGGMYLAIDSAISNGQKDDLYFDFGGSRVEGVRRFNQNFGGQDFEYFSYRINNGPFWLNWMRIIKSRWFKKS